MKSSQLPFCLEGFVIKPCGVYHPSCCMDIALEESGSQVGGPTRDSGCREKQTSSGGHLDGQRRVGWRSQSKLQAC